MLSTILSNVPLGSAIKSFTNFVKLSITSLTIGVNFSINALTSSVLGARSPKVSVIILNISLSKNSLYKLPLIVARFCSTCANDCVTPSLDLFSSAIASASFLVNANRSELLLKILYNAGLVCSSACNCASLIFFVFFSISGASSINLLFSSAGSSSPDAISCASLTNSSPPIAINIIPSSVCAAPSAKSLNASESPGTLLSKNAKLFVKFSRALPSNLLIIFLILASPCCCTLAASASLRVIPVTFANLSSSIK